MPRGRAQLTDKQERILVQAQLMGLTPKDMQQISNRLIALQKEAEDKREIAETLAGYTWESLKGNNWKIVTPDGYIVETSKGKKTRGGWQHMGYEYEFKVTKPGTRFKPRVFKNKSLYVPYDWKKSLMPNQSKELYAAIRWARDIKFEVQN